MFDTESGKKLAHARAERGRWDKEVRRLEEVAASDQCLYLREAWDGPYRMSDRCTQPAAHSSSVWRWDHGPWQQLGDQACDELVKLRKSVGERAGR